MGTKGFEFYRDEGPEFRSLRVDYDGTHLRISGQDMGKSVEDWFGKYDHEFWIDVPNDAVVDLAIALVRHHYADRAHAVTEIKEICQKFGVDHKFQIW